MKKISTLLTAILFVFSLNAQITVTNDLYTVTYSESYEQPLELTYSYKPFNFVLNNIVAHNKLGFASKSNGKISTFSYPNPSATTNYSWEVPVGILTSDAEDYKDNDYDKSHLVPKKQFDDKKNISFLYSYLNCALMHKTLNRGVWSSLEEYERELPGAVNVTVSLTFSDQNKTVKGGATIPSYFTKIIEYGGTGLYNLNDSGVYSKEIIREVYKFPNDSSVKGKTIDVFKIENLSGKFQHTL